MDFSPIRNIIFDLGNVIIDIDPERTYQAFSELSSLPLEDTLKKFNELEVFERYEVGEFEDEQFLKFLKKELRIPHPKNEILTAWNAILIDIPEDRIETIKRVSQSYQIYLLSNTSNYHVLATNNILHAISGIPRLDDLFDKAYYSYKLKLRKPDPEIYRVVLEDAGIKAEETLFLDDNADNVASASELGIHTIHVQKPSSITDYLRHA